CPPSCAREPVAWNEATGERDDKANGHFSHGIVENTRCVGYSNAATARLREVDRIATDTKVRDDLQRGKPVHDAGTVITTGEGANTRSHLRQQRLGIRRVEEAVDDKSVRQRSTAHIDLRVHLQKVDTHNALQTIYKTK